MRERESDVRPARKPVRVQLISAEKREREKESRSRARRAAAAMRAGTPRYRLCGDSAHAQLGRRWVHVVYI